MTVTITAHVPMEVYRRFNGLKQDERIKSGIYSYGPDSVGKISLLLQRSWMISKKK